MQPDGPQDASGPAVTSEPAQPPAEAPAAAPAVEQKTVTATKHMTVAATQQNESPQPRTDPIESLPTQDSQGTLDAQLRQIMQYWTLLNSQAHGNGRVFGNGR